MATSTPTTKPEVVVAAEERRQIAEVLEFDAKHAPHINWQSIGDKARFMRADFEARYTIDGDCTVTIFWKAI